MTPAGPAITGHDLAQRRPVRQAVVLVGGKGTRLGELAREIPKPLMPIEGDRRFLDYLLDEVARQGFDDVLLVCGHLGERVQERYASGRVRNARLRVVREPEARGTAGALREVAGLLDPAFLVMNGDAFLDLNLRAFERAAAALPTPHVLATLEVPNGARYGTVEVQDGRVRAFREKDPSAGGPQRINGGLYRLERAVLDNITAVPASLESQVFPALAARGELGAVAVSGYFIDIGLPDSLEQARAELPGVTRRPCAFLDRDGTLNLDAGYTHRAEELVWMPGAVEAIRLLNDRGYRVIVCTNQAGIAKGHFEEGAMHCFHAAMQASLAQAGAFIDAFYFCPYHVDGVVERYRVDHPDRKPKPGMLLRAMQEWSIARSRSFMIGDHRRDLEAAEAAGIRGYLYESGSLLDLVRRALSD